MRTASSNRTLSSDRPTLLVLDELDGADGQQAVACLVRMAQADLPLEKEKLGESGRRCSVSAKRKHRRRSARGRRPSEGRSSASATICTRLPLRQLRDVALVFQLRKPTVPRRLAQRLRTVADSEGVASSSSGPSNFS